MPELLWFEKLDSTRTKLETLMESQVRPLIVFAGEQSSGRGQVGRSWDSPQGNLYCSFSLLVGTLDDVSRLSLLPLMVAYMLRKVVADYYQLPLTIKWPNDLLISGKKVGGILCEAQSSQDRVDWVSVGFGLNTVVAGAADTYLSASLGEYRSLNFSRKKTEKVLQAIYEGVETLFLELGENSSRPSWLDELEEHQKGKILVDGKTRDLHKLVRLGDDGHLEIEELDDPRKMTSLYSANHSFKYLSQNQTLSRLFADIGNTSAKIFLSHQSQRRILVLDHTLSHSEKVSRLQDFFSKIDSLPNNFPVYCSSVNPEAFVQLELDLKKMRGLALKLIPKKRVFTQGSYNLETIGLDRLCLIEALATRMMPLELAPSKVNLVVSLGTATTIDAVNSSGVHLGGMILPGLVTSLEALEQKGALLPKLDVVQYVNAFDASKRFQTTESAMIEGCLHATLGSIFMFMQSLGTTKTDVYLTGGYSEILKSYIDKSAWAGNANWLLERELVFEGLQTIALN